MKRKYFVVYNDILNKIQTSYYKINSKLPSENELMGIYNVSRDTVRKALNMLEENGCIHKIKGKGSLVLDINKFDFPISGIVSFKELANKMNMNAKTFVEELELIQGDKVSIEHLNVDKDDKIWKSVRVRAIDDKRVILDKDYFNSNYVPKLTKKICEESVYKYIEETLNLKIAFAKKEFTVESVNDKDKELLDLEGYNMIVVVKSYTYLDDASLFQYTESRHRPDKFKFVDFARRIY